jgi:hypothetical protein
LQEGEAVVLCTDGLSGSISDEELRTIVEQHQPQESVYMLVERANENGGPDNITAIVVRVQEIGSDPPETRHPVYAGDVRNIANDDTLPMGMAPAVSASMPLRLENGRTPSSPLRYPTGPLSPPESIAPPQSVVRLPSRKRNRLLYPALAVFVLVLASLIIGIFYYLLHTNIDNRLAQADRLIRLANQEVQSNPITALQNLSTAQKILLDVQQSSLTDSERKRTDGMLNGPFLSAVRGAITRYNATYKISALPCSDTVPRAINLGSTNTHVNTIATIEDGKGTLFSYALGDDHKLYQLSQLPNNQYSVVNPLTPLGSTVEKIASDTTRLLGLVAQSAAGSTPAKYSLHLLTPNAAGLLQDTNTPASIDPTLTQGSNLSLVLTAWESDAYVIMSSTAAQNTATIVDYQVSTQHNMPVMKPVGIEKISISTTITSVAAFPNHQLFLLLSDGSVQSLLFAPGNQKAQSVLIRQPIAPALSVKATDFVPTMPVPAVNGMVQSSSFLSVSQANLLVAGVVENAPHLYIVDGLYHRVLDLQMPQAVASTGTSGTGGATSSSTGGAMTMELLQQYASLNLLAHVTSIVADPKTAQLSLLTQTATSPLSLLSIDVSQKTPCSA